jgi:transcriptional regulator of aromatic amino acid metabolism
MDMLLRDIDPIAVKKIDEIAKEKKISRQEFLKGQVETLAVFQEQKDREAELENIIYQNIKMMEKCALAIETINGFIQDMMGEDEE